MYKAHALPVDLCVVLLVLFDMDTCMGYLIIIWYVYRTCHDQIKVICIIRL